MGHREATAGEFGEERLDVAEDRASGRRVAHVADGGRAFEVLDGGAVGERIADEAGPAFGMEDVPVEGDDACRLLAPVLEGVEAERHDGGGVRMAENAEDAALFAQRVPVPVQPIHHVDRMAGARAAC